MIATILHRGGVRAIQIPDRKSCIRLVELAMDIQVLAADARTTAREICEILEYGRAKAA